MKKLGTTSKGVISLALLTFFSNLPTNGGEDVANARNNAFSDYPIDFWGGVSSFFYSLIPDFPLGWAVHLLIFQVVLIAISLIVFIEKQKIRSRKFKIVFLIFDYTLVMNPLIRIRHLILDLLLNIASDKTLVSLEQRIQEAQGKGFGGVQPPKRLLKSLILLD